MDIVIYCAHQLFGECLESCLKPQQDVDVVAVVHDADAVRAVLERLTVDLLLVDVAPGIDALKIASISDDYPGLVSIAVGLAEHDSEVLQCGRVGFAGYVPRDASLEMLDIRMRKCVGGRKACPDEIASCLLRAVETAAAGQIGAAAADPVEMEPFWLSAREVTITRDVVGYRNIN